ncbi:hypothetical protein V6D52_03760 [Idiomarina loihiensis]|uniref:hypothetical protein n=1 Tax=Idiomarina loihiensis TaxID=135577 RepID=UPI0039BE68F7
MNSSELIDLCTYVTEKGFIYIKPLSSIKLDAALLDAFDSVHLWDTNRKSQKQSGSVLFGQRTWISYENTSRNLVFIDDGSKGGRLDLEMRLYALVSHFRGKVEGSSGFKLSTLQSHIATLKKLALWMRRNGFESFHHLEDMSDFALRNFFHSYLTEELKISSQRPWRTLDDLFTPQSSLGLFSTRVCHMLSEVKNSLLAAFHKNKNTAQSHSIIPTPVHKKTLKFASTVIDNCEAKIDEWEAQNEIILLSLDRDIRSQRDRKNAKLVPNIILGGVVNNSFDTKGFTALSSEFDDLKLAVYIYILSFTGMRYNEVLSCKLGCGEYIDGTYTVSAETTKVNESKLLVSWVANKETYQAIKLLERYVTGMMRRAEKIIGRWSKWVLPEQLHNLAWGLEERRLFSVTDSAFSISFAESGRFTGFDVKCEKYQPLFDLTLTAQCIEELERLECNYASLRGDKKGKPYKVGDKFNLTNHMFRHTWAYFVVANKLGHHDDVTHQFKHLSKAMSAVYGDRGLLAADELVELVEGFERVLTKQVANELADQAGRLSLRGGAGERFNKAAQSLVIGITDSTSGNKAHIKQVHFKDIQEFKAFLVKNIDMVRGLPHGYCTAGDACKIKGAAVPAGCVACGSFVVAERHKHHWVAMKKNAESKLSRYNLMSPEQQAEYELFKITWEKDLKAANRVLIDNNEPTWQKAEGTSYE